MILRTAKRMEESGVRMLDGFDADDAEFQAELVRRRFRSLRGSGAVGAAPTIGMRNGIDDGGRVVELQKRAERWREKENRGRRKVHCDRFSLDSSALVILCIS